MNAPVSTIAARSIRIAVLAMGGEGGGVLADWIIDLAEHSGHIAQLTSVPGVAQRTGATIYYLELFPRAAAEAAGRLPVLALMPVPGDVDIVIASELMEAGRAVQRGFVTPDRTTLIASTGRVFAMTEKIAMGDGRGDAPVLRDACRTAARRFVAFDMGAVAEAAQSHISAVMFGALAGAAVLPFERDAFEATIARGGVGVAASKRAFDAGFDGATGRLVVQVVTPAQAAKLPASSSVELRKLYPPAALPIIEAGLARLKDYQDSAYAQLYLERLKPMAVLEHSHGDGSGRLILEVARYLALGMSYEDTIRVAELKTRAARFERVRGEVQAKGGQIVEVAEFLHPRLQEIAETVPAPLGRFMLSFGPLRRTIERATARGRIVKTSSLRGFATLYCVASLKKWRRKSLRYAQEQTSLEAWLARVAALAVQDYNAAVEFAECRNLVKGYGDTLERGRANYAAIEGALERLLARQQPAAAIARLRAAALADDTGAELRAAMGRE